MTLNMSSSGILVEDVHGLSVGALVELRIGWPSRLEGRIGLQLVAVGKVVRCDPSSFAVLLRNYQFRIAHQKNQRMVLSPDTGQPVSRPVAAD